MNVKLEVVIIPVSHVDRANRSVRSCRFRLDIDIVNEKFRGVQFTSPRSETSIIFGNGMTSAKRDSGDSLCVREAGASSALD